MQFFEILEWDAGQGVANFSQLWNRMVVRGSLGHANVRSVERDGDQGWLGGAKFGNVHCRTGWWSWGRLTVQFFAIWNGMLVEGSVGRANLRNVEQAGRGGGAVFPRRALMVLRDPS